jgi:hypothetical protein
MRRGYRVRAALAVAVFIGGLAFSLQPKRNDLPSVQVTEAAAVTCFFQREETSGLNKICYYDCLGSPAAITIRASQICPVTIRQ